MNRETLVCFQHVSFGYPGGEELFRDLCLDISAGDFYLLRGASGTGKSSLLRLINRLEEPWSGELLLKGRPYTTYPPAQLRRSVLYIQQTPVVSDGSIRDNLLFPFEFKANKDLEVPGDDSLLEMLKTFSIHGAGLEKNARNLSVGQQQRLCLIRGLLLSPDIVLLDEPTSALDEESAFIVESWAERLCVDQGKTVVMANHRSYVPRGVSPKVLTLAGGKVSTGEVPTGPRTGAGREGKEGFAIELPGD